ncbi:MAG: hypothetical protein JOZ57_17535 [Abitibacteriaceae bacterium]|nr:hypothetical protein [Abditibacteriaceae bacterium]
MSPYPTREKSCQPSSGKTLFVLLLLSATQVSLFRLALPPALAQPATTKLPSPSFQPLSSDTRAAIGKAMHLVRLMESIKVPLKLKVTNASLEDITARIKAALPAKVLIEVRQPSPARFTLELRDMPAAQILDAVAALSGNKLYVLSDRLLIAQDNQLTDAEHMEAKEWGQSNDAREHGWSAVAQADQIILPTFSASFQAWDSARNNPAGDHPTPIVISLGELSPELQQLVQFEDTRTKAAFGRMTSRLSPDTIITFDGSNPNWHSLRIQSRSQGQDASISYRPR